MDRKAGFYKVKAMDTWGVAEWNTEFWWIHGCNIKFDDDHFDIIIETPIQFDEKATEYVIIDIRHSDDYLYFVGPTSLVGDINKAKRFSEEEVKTIKIQHALNNAAIHRMAIPVEMVPSIFRFEMKFPLAIDELKSLAIKHDLDKYVF